MSVELTAARTAYVVYGDSTSGQKAVYRLGMTGIPVFNVNNNCSTGSTALFLARQGSRTLPEQGATTGVRLGDGPPKA